MIRCNETIIGSLLYRIYLTKDVKSLCSPYLSTTQYTHVTKLHVYSLELKAEFLKKCDLNLIIMKQQKHPIDEHSTWLDFTLWKIQGHKVKGKLRSCSRQSLRDTRTKGNPWVSMDYTIFLKISTYSHDGFQTSFWFRCNSSVDPTEEDSIISHRGSDSNAAAPGKRIKEWCALPKIFHN